MADAAAKSGFDFRMLLKTGLGVPLGVLGVLAMVIVPLPPIALDALFTFNIALSIVIVMSVFYVARPVEFGVFPTILLLATLLRLALNVASTRVVLLHGHSGSHAAGNVIESFGQFVIGGNFAVGVVVFIILTIINFVVVTKGSGRISEVSARFTLDAMPGKQMAIDADLNAGLITQEEAKVRRQEVRAEADFYGSMDGASKFVRGDAVAGILILFINMIGGLCIGMMGHGLPFAQAGKTYTLLTIGDGLVTQIPALLLSTAVAIIVTRMSGAQDMGGELTRQLFRTPKALGVAAGLLTVMGLVPGMPNLAFLAMGAARRLGRLDDQEEAGNREHAGSEGGRRCQGGCGKSVGGATGTARAVVGRRAAGRPARTRGRVSPRAAGEQEPEWRSARAHSRRTPQAVDGPRLPRASRAHPRQPRISAPMATASISAACRWVRVRSIRIARWRSIRVECSGR